MLGRALASAQTIAVRGDVCANIAQHLRLAKLAADEGARIVVFPELSLTGYELDLARELAFSEADPRLEPVIAFAADQSLTLIVGAPVLLASGLHIGAFIVSPDRSLAIHTKRRMGAFTLEECPDGVVPPPESSVFEPGALRPLLRRDMTVAALGICAESLGRSHVREAAEQGANTYLASHFAIPSDVERRHEVMRSNAEQHGMAVVFSSYAGQTAGLRASGRSAIFSPAGVKLAELDSVRAGVAVAIESDAGWRASCVASP
jgi:predicted amidohydrolase